ncbi:MAG: hypothetical protein WC256_11675 [Desulfurivibrionaceae bacterium]|jgi:hypothetical protein
MKEGDILGIIKFFRNEDHLDQLCNGKIFCNTPEFYRLHDKDGVADCTECCTWSFRKNRGDTGAKIVVEGHSIGGLTNITFRATGAKDSWLHCWTILRMPINDEELESLVKDIKRIRSEFGLNYAYIQPSKINQFINRIKTLTKHEVKAGEVVYSENFTDWSPACKNTNYEYQREFRILIGECQELSTEPLIIESPQRFSDVIMKNINFKISSEDDAWIWFGLNGTEDIAHNKPM